MLMTEKKWLFTSLALFAALVWAEPSRAAASDQDREDALQTLRCDDMRGAPLGRLVNNPDNLLGGIPVREFTEMNWYHLQLRLSACIKSGELRDDSGSYVLMRRRDDTRAAARQHPLVPAPDRFAELQCPGYGRYGGLDADTRAACEAKEREAQAAARRKQEEEVARDTEFNQRQVDERRAGALAARDQEDQKFRWTPDIFTSFEAATAYIDNLPPSYDSVAALKAFRTEAYQRVKPANMGSDETIVRQNALWDHAGKRLMEMMPIIAQQAPAPAVPLSADEAAYNRMLAGLVQQQRKPVNTHRKFDCADPTLLANVQTAIGQQITVFKLTNPAPNPAYAVMAGRQIPQAEFPNDATRAMLQNSMVDSIPQCSVTAITNRGAIPYYFRLYDVDQDSFIEVQPIN